MTEVHTDGNGVAGLLSEVFAVEVTTVQRRCHSCGAENALGAHRAYQGAGRRAALPGVRRRGDAHRRGRGPPRARVARDVHRTAPGLIERARIRARPYRWARSTVPSISP